MVRQISKIVSIILLYQGYLLQVKVAPDNEMGRHAASRTTVLNPVLQKQSR